MTDRQAKAAAMATRLLVVDAAILQDTNVIILMKAGWIYKNSLCDCDWQPAQRFRLLFGKAMGSGVSFTSLTVFIP